MVGITVVISVLGVAQAAAAQRREVSRIGILSSYTKQTLTLKH